MRPAVLGGLIRRRILVNFRVDPDVIQAQLPPAFRPKLLAGSAVAGICLIKLESLRPPFLPAWFGLKSDNAAHRIAVRWTDNSGAAREGVYVPRRDTNSRLAALAGGRLFPGRQHHAAFDVNEDAGAIDLRVKSDDGHVEIHLRGRECDRLPESTRFHSLQEASEFFEKGDVGYSATANPSRVDGMRLQVDDWQVVPLSVDSVSSSFFSDESRFPAGSVTFDSALLMRNLCHSWHKVPSMAIDAPEMLPAAVPLQGLPSLLKAIPPSDSFPELVVPCPIGDASNSG